MITAPSTISPKSSAPRLIRLALILALQHAGSRHQHGQRNDQRRDERRAEIAEQGEQDQDHQQRAFARFLATVAIVASTSCGPVEHGL